MGEGAANVLPPQLPVEPNGGVDVPHDRGRATGEAAAPLQVGRFVSAVLGQAVLGQAVLGQPVRWHGIRRVGHEKRSSRMLLVRRTALRMALAGAAGTLAATA